MRAFFIYYFFLIGLNLNVLIAQKLQVQTSLNDVDEVIQSPKAKYLLLKKQDDYILLDQTSKIQVGFIKVELERTLNIGSGLFRFVDESKFIINDTRNLMLIDILNTKIDTLKIGVNFPEFIENFIALPNEPSKIIVTTKKYPINKDGTVSSIKSKSKELFWEDIKNGNIYVYDLLLDKIVASKSLPYSVTYLTKNENDEVIAGCFDGSVLKINPDLNFELLFKAFNYPVFNIINKRQKFLVIPHQEKNYIGEIGKGEIYLFDKNYTLIKTINLPIQTPKSDQINKVFKVLPHNLVLKILNPENKDLVYINYGFNGLSSLNLKNLELINFNVDKNSVKFYSLNFDNSQIIATINSDDTSIYGHTGYLTLYDIVSYKFIEVFSKIVSLKQFNDLSKVFFNGNYYYVGETKESFKNPTLTIYGSNQNQVSKLSMVNKMYYNSFDNLLLLQNYERLVIGQLKLDKISKKDYIFKMKDFAQPIDSFPKEIFDIKTDVSFSNNTIPFEILFFKKIDDDKYFFYGYDYQKKDNIYSYMVINLKGEKLFEKKNKHTSLSPNHVKISPTGKYILIEEKNSDGFLEIWDWKNNVIVYKQKFKSFFSNYQFDKTQDILWFREVNEQKYYNYYTIDLNQQKIIPLLHFSNLPYTSNFLADNKNDKIYFNQEIYRLSTNTLIGAYKFPLDDFSIKINLINNEIGFSSKSSYVSVDGEKHVCFYAFEDDSAIEYNQDLYFKASKQSQENIGVVYNGQGLSVSNFDVYFNRPDIIIKQNGSSNEDYNSMVGKAVLKRNNLLKKTESLNTIIDNAPEIKVLNHDEIKSFIKSDSLEFKLSFNTKMSRKIKSLSININGIQVVNNTTLNGENSISQKIKLSKGLNSIYLNVMDSEGYKSNDLIYTVFAEYQQNTTPKVYLVYFAVDKYENADYNLKYAVKDANDLSETFAKRYGDNLIVKSFINENATMENVLKVTQELLNVDVNDKVILFVSGHGVLDKNLDFRFATSNMDFNKVDNYGITYADLENILLKSNARNKLFMLDACHSGNLDKEEYVVEDNIQNVVTYSGYKGAIAKQTGTVTNNSFELMQELFNEISVKNGIKVLSAAAGNSYALESDVWNNGVFTYSVLKTLQDNKNISISKFNEIVSESVYNLTNSKQKPTSRGNVYEFDFTL